MVRIVIERKSDDTWVHYRHADSYEHAIILLSMYSAIGDNALGEFRAVVYWSK